MYPNSQSVRHQAQTLTLNSQYLPPAYDFTGFQHHVSGVVDPSASAWNPVYTPREDFPFGFAGSSPIGGQVGFTSPELSSTPSTTGGGSLTPYSFIPGQDPFRRPPEPVRHAPPASGGKTRTKDKYRVVYTDQQRQELEKEFQCNRYITMRRKSELSMALSLTERQVKIWFQNRRAKERKMNKKRLQQSQQASTTTPASPALADAHLPSSPGTSSLLMTDVKPEEY
ncbi:homeobox protein CHOX-CAD-like [Nematolebias whitei]|uniref:homeobox protein CHOX-CAD-like n=1 Tax=Nematolebias whitei TaxID=451745 RepID=UPI0018982C21|nr:homeobox protein CHOX-CAD-like [Nematolebias whitei]